MAFDRKAYVREYNRKKYKRWYVDLRPDLWERIESERGRLQMSRQEYLDHLLKKERGD